jgi:carboxyl-terminal processing protease
MGVKNKLLWVCLLSASVVQAARLVAPQPPILSPLQSQSEVTNVTSRLFGRFHYKKVQLDDALSAQILERYLKELDPERLFFVQSDIDTFAEARDKLDDAIANDDLRIPFAIFNVYERRVAERFSQARAMLAQGFDFSRQENYYYSRDKAPWAKSEAEVRDLWRLRVKNDWLRLKLAGKEAAAIRETLDKRYENSLARVAKYKSEDAFQLFMDAYATSIEPHTNYLGPRASEDFDISMKLSLVGIGAVLQERDEYTTIRELVAGGPALLSGKLKVGDRIVGVGQGAKGPLTDVVGWRIDEVVRLIRGTKDTVVVLDILPADAGPDAKHQLVSLVRNKISLEQQAAKKSILESKNGNVVHRIGVITLPTFYLDFDARRRGDKNFKSATRDVARLLGELKKEKVDSVLIDLRHNGGGSLTEAVDLTGLFIDKGPVVQQRNAIGKVAVESDSNAGVAWDGPLGVLINRGSASASEIFAAAIQDYGRGLVIGESSFGKGTVQTLINLDEMAQEEKRAANAKPVYGELKMTIAQFFRINGGTTQLRGVTPDIALPSISDPERFGESSYDNALPWTQIKAADYKPVGDLGELLPLLQGRHQARIAKDRDFQYLLEDIAELKAQRQKSFISLNENERRKERDVLEARLKAREQADGKDKSDKTDKADKAIDPASLRDDGLESGERKLGADLAAEKAQKNAKDVLLKEAVAILGDEVELLRADRKLAARALPAVSPLAARKREAM